MISGMMFHLVCLLLAGLVYLLTMCSMKTLWIHHRHAIAVHNRIREARNLRRQYIELN